MNTEVMILAETMQFGPDERRLILLIGAIVLALLACAVALAIGGVVAGYRFGLDPSRTRSRIIWSVAIIVEAPFVVLSLLSLEPFWILVSVGLATTTVASRALGNADRERA